MLRNFTLFTVAWMMLSFHGLAQGNAGKVSGMVIDGNVKTIESATITLQSAKDSSVAKMSVADKTGNFSFDNLAFGSYFISITAVGHQKSITEIFVIDEAHLAVRLKTIELVPVAKEVSGVTVTSRKPLIEQKIDRTIVNVDASITNVGNSALEVLEKSPGITVDKDGNISLKGKSGVQVFIDGKPSYLSGQDLANMLRSMTAAQLDQIEIMTNPPAKYDAAGNSGVINIKTKKNKQFGYNGSLTTGYTQGRYARFNESGNFNYRSGKLNVFTNLSYNRNKRRQGLFIDRNFRETVSKDIISRFEQESDLFNQNHFYSAKVGLDYAATKKTSYGLVLNGFYNPSEFVGTTHTLIKDPSDVLLSQTGTISANDEKWKNFSTNFNFQTVLDSSGQEITANLDYIQYRATNRQPLVTSYYDPSGTLLATPDTLVGTLPQDITIYSGKIDYLLPLKNGARFEAGFKTSFVRTDNNASYDTLRGGESIHDFNRSNHFLYEENINAAYVNYSRPINKKWNGQVGLRVENTNAKGDQLTTGVQFRRNYTQLFPTAYLQFKANESHSWVMNYGRRINRPDYQSLNPFINFIDRYTFQQGNPNLRPQFAHNIELSHTYKGFLTTTLNYTATTDIIQEVLEQDESRSETYIKSANIASSKQLGIAISAQKEITKWWSGNVYINVFNNHYEGLVNNEPISLGLTMGMMQIQQQFKWGKGWGAEVSGFYRTKGVEGVIFIRPMGQVSAGFSKQVLKNKGSLRLNVRDIFAAGVFKGYSQYGNVDAQFTNVNDSRALSLSFTWRFSKGKMNGGGQRKKGGADEELNRVRSGN